MFLKVLALALFAVATTNALKCYDYDGTGAANKPVMDQSTPMSDCPSGADTFCHNSYNPNTPTWSGGCVVGTTCETGTTADGTRQFCCNTNGCNQEAEPGSASRVQGAALVAAAAAVAAMLL